MTELEKIAYTKIFIDKLANGINPLDDTAVPEGDLVRQERISRCMSYVSGILEKVIENGGIRPERKKVPALPFSASGEDMRAYVPSEEPIPLSVLAHRISDQVGAPDRGALCYRELAGALVSMGLLEILPRADGRQRRSVTADGAALGITSELRDGKSGKFPVIVYSPEAQRFLADNFDTVMAHILEIREERERAREQRKNSRAARGRENPDPV